MSQGALSTAQTLLLLLRVQDNLLSASPKHARSQPCPAAPRHFSTEQRRPLSQMLPLGGPGPPCSQAEALLCPVWHQT